MKYALLLFSVSCLCYWASTSFVVPPSSPSPKEHLTFYQVNLICGVATDIGCGSRSKPILLDLEKEKNIKEAWLNRSGTVVAVVWQENSAPQPALVPAIFRKHRTSVEELSGKAHQNQRSSFYNDPWYRGAEVDRLSMEEAGRIASQVVDRLLAGNILLKEDASKMQAVVKAYIQRELLTLQDVSLLNQRSYYDGWENAIKKIGKQFVGEGNMPETELCDFARAPSADQKKPSCCTKRNSGKSCSPPNRGS